MIKNLLSKKFMFVILLSMGVFMVIMPDVAEMQTKQAIALWYNNVVPTLLPFFIFANFVKEIGVVKHFPMGIYPAAMGILSGYPMGAKVCGDLYLDGVIDSAEMKNMLAYSMITSPAFILGTVGCGFLHSYKSGMVILVSHYMSALISVLFNVRNSNKLVVDKKPVRNVKKDEPYYNLLTEAILDSFKSIGMILAYIMIFFIILGMLEAVGVFGLIDNHIGIGVFKGFLEMTVGCSEISMLPCSMYVKTILTTMVVTFGGISILCQSKSMLNNDEISMWYLLRLKGRQSLIAGLVSGFVGMLIR